MQFDRNAHKYYYFCRMSKWIEITRELVLQRATTMESDIVDVIGTQDGISTLEQVVVSACAEVRGAIAQAGFRLPNDSTLSVPPSLVNDTLSIVIYHLASRALADTTLNQAPRDLMYRNAKQKLDAIRNHLIGVEDFDTGDIAMAGVAVKTVRIKNPYRDQWRNL